MGKREMILSFNEWADLQKEDKYATAGSFYNQPVVVDLATAEYLAPLVTGWFNSPTALLGDGQAIAALSKSFDSIDEVFEYFVALNKREDIYIYKVYYALAVPVLRMVDPATFKEVVFDRPQLGRSIWKIRFASINNDFKIAAAEAA